MDLSFAAAVALFMDRLAMAMSSAFCALRNDGINRRLMLATPSIPHRSFMTEPLRSFDPGHSRLGAAGGKRRMFEYARNLVGRRNRIRKSAQRIPRMRLAAMRCGPQNLNR